MQEQKKKILILSYFFPPCNLTASQRTQSWAKYLSGFGLYPIIVTRRWDHKIHTYKEMALATPNIPEHIRSDNYEIYYTPYKPNLRDKLYTKEKYPILRRLLSLKELILQNIFIKSSPIHILYNQAQEIIKNQNIDFIAASGNPYIQFKYAARLSREYNILWFADYRDAWTTSSIDNIGRSSLFNIIYRYDQLFEKKWIKSAQFITASSYPIAQSITKLTGTKGYSIHNGFEQNDFNNYSNLSKYNNFTITYIGTLYQGQKIEVFIDSVILFIKENPTAKIKVLFPGLAFLDAQKNRIQNLISGYEQFFEISDRVDREKILEIEMRSHVLLHVAWKDHQGIIASKIYEYLGSGTHILVTPSDHGEIDKIIQESNGGTLTNTVDETYNFLLSAYKEYEKTGFFGTKDTSRPELMQFTREEQAKKLAMLIHENLS
ncbi:MAG: hypothetical protein C0594_11280 [Marinilabiliales bacterium]|nr:MAG: hypothetical protein C0594_11280 [Marinilabiliales bacterium]